jgi:hypothetical protein
MICRQQVVKKRLLFHNKNNKPKREECTEQEKQFEFLKVFLTN